MKKVLLIFTSCFLGNVFLAQTTMKQADNASPLLNITSDVKVTATQDTKAKGSAATGNLGLSFIHKYWYGSTLFTVINRNQEVETKDTNEVKIFSNNLLIPENSGQGLSSFYITLGRKTFIKFEENKDWTHANFFERLGFAASLQVNNTIWKKDTVESNLAIFSPGLYLTFNLLDFTLDNKDEDKVYLSLFGGLQGRVLGGDYGLAGNDSVRKHFLNLKHDRTNFYLTTFGAKLELGKFYGKFQGTYTWGKDDLKGFSGWQALITLGLNIDFNVKTKTNGGSKAVKKDESKVPD